MTGKIILSISGVKVGVCFLGTSLLASARFYLHQEVGPLGTGDYLVSSLCSSYEKNLPELLISSALHEVHCPSNL